MRKKLFNTIEAEIINFKETSEILLQKWKLKYNTLIHNMLLLLSNLKIAVHVYMHYNKPCIYILHA